MLREYPYSFHTYAVALFLSIASIFALIAVFGHNYLLFIVIPVFFIGIGFFRRPSVVIYPLTAVALLRLDAWLSFCLSIPFGKLLFMLVLVSLAAVIFLTRSKINRPGQPFLLYGAFMVAMLVFGLVESSRAGAVLWFEESLYAAVYFVVFYMLVNRFERLERVILLIVVLGAVTSVLNIVELVAPWDLPLSHSSGRSAGLLKNANTSAFIVNLSMAASIYALQVARSKRVAVLIVMIQALFFFGVFTTFSREGVLLFAAIFLAQLMLTRKGSHKALIVALAGIILVAGVVGTVHFISSSAVEDVRFSFQKISTLAQGRIDDNDRLWLLRIHLRRFIERPLTGNGLYSALMYSIPTEAISMTDVPNGPHNTFALILSEAGIFPLIVYVAFLLSLLKNLVGANIDDGDLRGKAMRRCLLLLFAALAVHHFFSHMLTLARYPAVLFAILALPGRVLSPKEGHRGSCEA